MIKTGNKIVKCGTNRFQRDLNYFERFAEHFIKTFYSSNNDKLNKAIFHDELDS